MGVAPCYLKSHSRGEYVFDYGWAEAYERAGGSYYPKLQVAVPFTPATGRRLLVRPAPDPAEVAARSLQGLVEMWRPTRRPAHVTFCLKTMALSRRARIPAAHRPTIPLGQSGLPTLRRFSRRTRRAQTQDHPPRAARCGRKRHRQSHWLTGARSDRRRPGTLSSRSTWRRARANGAVLISPGRFFSLIGESMRDRILAGHGQARGTLDRRRASISSVRTRSMAAIGAPSSIIRSCISNFATIRRSNMRSRTSCRASRPARRASTRSRAATCRRRLIPRIISPIRRCAAPSPIISKRERAYVAAAGEELARRRTLPQECGDRRREV